MGLRYLALGCALLLLSSGSANAQCSGSTAQLVMHLVPDSVATIPCGSSPFSCSTPIEASGELDQTYKAYVLLTRWDFDLIYPNDGIYGVEIGVNYDGVEGSGVDVLDFQAACYITTTPVGDWPNPGSQLRMSFPVCVTRDAVEDPHLPLVLGWFRVVAHTPGQLSLGTPVSGGSGKYVSRLTTCDENERLLDPVNQGNIGLGAYGLNPCSIIIDAFEGPCCFPNHTCQEGWSVACCWDQGGVRLFYTDTCAQCATPVLPNTWGRLKSRYE